MLATFGMSEEQIKATTKAAADFAAATGRDLSTSVEMLGKAFAGNTASLGKFGIVIDESIPKSERFAAALQQLQDRFGGSAEAATHNFQGGMAQVKNALGEVQEGLGKVIGELFRSDEAFGIATSAANSFAMFLKQDVVLAIGEARATFAEMMADMLDSKVGRVFDTIGAALNRDFVGAWLAATGETKKANEELAAGFRKTAADFREESNQAAVAAGKLQQVTNAHRDHRRALDEVAKAQRTVIDQMRDQWTGVAAQKEMENLAKAIGDLNNVAPQMMDDLVKKVQELLDKGAELPPVFADLADQLEAAGPPAKDLVGTIEQLPKQKNLFAGMIDLTFLEGTGNAVGKIKDKTIDWSSALADVAHQLQAMGGAGGLIGSLAGGIASIGAQFQRLKTDVSKGGLAGAGGLGGVLGKLSSGLGIAGAAFGIGKGIFDSIFGGAKKAREELAKFKDQVVKSYGSMEAFAKTAAKAGVDVSKAFSTKDPKEFERIMKEANAAIDAQKQRLEGLKTAMGGLELLTRSFATFMAKSGEATAGTQEQFTRLGTFAMATFAGLVKETGDVIGALQQMAPSLDSLAQTMTEFGFSASGALGHLLSLRTVVAQNQEVADSISGLNQLMKGLGDAGLITRDLLVEMGAQARDNFDALIAQGVSANDAMALMQPTLQELWERQKQLGATYDENTQKLIDQAEEQGLVGDNMMDVNEQILEVLMAIGEVLGAAIPTSLRRMGDEAETQFGRMAGAAAAAGDAAGGSAGYSRFEPSPGFANEGYIPATPPYGRHIRVSEQEGEYVLKESTLKSLVGGGSRTIIVQVGSRAIAKVVEGGEARGDVAPKSRLRRAG